MTRSLLGVWASLTAVVLVHAAACGQAPGHAAEPARGSAGAPTHADAAPPSPPDRARAKESPNTGKTPPSAAGSAGAIRVWYCTQSKGFKHDVLPFSREVMTALDAQFDWLSVTLADDASALTRDKLKSVDVVMLFTTGDIPLDVAMLKEWIDAGGGLVGVHSATDTLASNPAYVALIGGSFDGHPWTKNVTLVANDRDAPMTRMWTLLTEVAREATPKHGEALTFDADDEIYQFKSLAKDIHPLFSLHAVDDKGPSLEKGRAYPTAWTRAQGQGRVFYTALGHKKEMWKDQHFAESLLEGIRWAARVNTARKCPDCAGALVAKPIIYGLPGPDGIPAVNEGKAFGAGCIMEGEALRWQCDACKHVVPGALNWAEDLGKQAIDEAKQHGGVQRSLEGIKK